MNMNEPGADPSAGGLGDVPCCPKLETIPACETIDVRYRLPFRPTVGAAGQQQGVAVDVTLRFRLERCSGPLSLGDILYTTTLLPGEKVQLFTSDRHSRFSYDSSTSLAYRQETTSEESLFTSGMASAMSNVAEVDNSNASSSYSNSAVSGGGGAGLDLGVVSIGGSASGSSYNAQSASAFAHNAAQHADSSSRHVEAAVRAASSTSVGEVQTRSHAQGQSEDQYESSSRTFANPNTCRAISFFFYRINKSMTVRFTLVGIDRSVNDPLNPTSFTLQPAPRSKIAVISEAILPTRSDRLAAEQTDRASVSAHVSSNLEFLRASMGFAGGARIARDGGQAAHAEALKQVDRELVEAGLFDAQGEVSQRAQELYGWTRTVVLPTPGVIVKGCLDECDICEPLLHEKLQLENALLKRRIELLDKSQDYRCCPAGEVEAA